MQMHNKAPLRSAAAPALSSQIHVAQCVYAAVNGHAQAIVVARPETRTPHR